MHEQAAKTLIKDTFQQPYDLGRFREFVRNLMKGYEERHTSSQIPDNFKDSIKSMYRVGKVRDDAGNEIDLLAVTLAKETSLDRARTMQRNFIARHLSVRDKEAALVAFVSPDSDSWRFSLVRRELSLTRNLKGKTKAVQDFSPARRFSFLVGKNERTHTAQRQLIELLKSDNRPSLKILEKAFNIEQVTEEFFEEYRELFNRVHEVIKAYVDKHPATKAHFAEKDIDPADFAKRLLGQIVFLYFLQKKRWLGVPTGKQWGEGSPTFLRDLYYKAEGNKQNFFHEYLQPLFYDALNRDHSDNKHYHKLFDSRIPFLNGGLFEPYHDYDWTEQNIKLPNSLFHELGSSLFGDDGKGILDVFDRYNFTVAEDEPLEREVAIDPEMLGKVFEKLLPVKERGKLGTFYTPREIVHYMCQESLIAYLSSHFPTLDRTELDDFIRYGDLLMEHDSKILRDGVSETYKDFFLGATIRANLKAIDEALKTVKVCDPAIGSGAFPVGMMSEIVRARKVLAAHMRHERPSYDLKRETIQESLYGVDFDPGAIEIAKLRLWLSLVVDEDNFDEIQALPNLDYKIMQGNSLLQSYEGIKLFEDSLLKQHDHTTRRRKQLEAEFKEMQERFMAFVTGSTTMSNQKERTALEKALREKKKEIDSYLEKAKSQEDTPLFAKASKAVELAERLKKLHAEFFDTDRPKKKKELKAEIEALEWQLIETSLREKNKADKIPDIKKLQRHNVKPYFLWKLHFNEVFTGDNGGFDIVIANPPYAASFDEANKQILSELYPTVPDYESANYFERKGLEIAADGGFICYIIPNTFLVNVNGKKYRKNILQDWQIKNIVNLSNFQVFDSAGVRNCIPFYQKSASEKKHPFEFLEFAENKGVIKRIPLKNSDLEDNIGNWLTLFSQDSSTRDVIAKIRNSSHPLLDFATVSQGLIPYDKYRGHSEETIKNRIWHSDTKIDETYKKELKGKDIDRYSLKWNGKLWISYGDWLAAPRNPDFFRKPRIIIREITNPKILATYTEEEFYNTPSIINLINFSGIEPLVMLGLLNSKLMSYFHYETSPKSKKGMFPKILVNDVRQLPIASPTTRAAEKIMESVLAILDQKKQNPDADVSPLEAAINAEVYKLYHLTDAEIAIIEEAVK
jgi:hypothetical protein